MEPIYLDYNATTPLDAEVLAAMMPYLTNVFGNAISFHHFGRQAAAGLEKARQQVASFLKCQPQEVIFTGGGTESNNTVIQGLARQLASRGKHIITSQIEHPSIIKGCQQLALEGWQVTFLPVDSYGQIDLDQLAAAINDQTALISIMHANNEVGTIQPIAEISALAQSHGAYFHTDAAQSISKLPLDFSGLKLDLLTVAAHKFYGPKGIGALIVREGLTFSPWMLGAGHEAGRRAGTVNVAGAVGLGHACHLAETKGADIIAQVQAKRDLFYQLICAGLGSSHAVKLNGHPTQRLPNTLNLSFPGCDGQEILQATNLAASLGAACHTSSRQPSAVLSAMGVSAIDALGAIRFSFGKFISEAEVSEAATRIVKVVKGQA